MNNWTEILSNPDFMAGGAFGAFVGFALVVLFLVIIGYYVFSSLAYQSIFRKSGYKRAWMAWIPIANFVPVLELGGFHWAWVFLIIPAMIPVIGSLFTLAIVVLGIICMWRIFENAGYHPALSLLLLIPIANLIVLGIVAWQKKSYSSKAKRKR